MIEMRLLELQAQFTNHTANSPADHSLGLGPGRSREDIARDYGQALREFLNA